MNIKAIIFDFDGVLVESVDIKTEAFAELFKDYPEHIEEIKQHHILNGGISRYEKIRHYYKNILKISLSDKRFQELCDYYSRLVMDKVISAPSVTGANVLIEKCFGHYQMFIISGTPESEMREIVKKRKLTVYFDGIFGSPRRKDEIIKEIIRRYNFKPDQIIFIGDSVNDLEASKLTGIHFLARVPEQDFPWINDSTVIAKFQDLTTVYLFLENFRKCEKELNHQK